MEKRNEVPYAPHTPDCSVNLNGNAIDQDYLGNFSENITDQLVNSSNISAMSYGDELIKRDRYGFLEKLKRIKPQIASVLGGYLQLVISGLHLVLGIWWLDFMSPFADGGKFICVMLSYNVNAIIGGIIAGFLINRWRKQTIYYLSGSIMVISSFILTIWSTDEVGVLFSRAIAGLGHGIVYNVVVIHAGENAMKETRGIVTSIINFIIWSSIFIASLLIATIQTGASVAINFDRIFGILSLVISIIAIICTKYWTQESVVHLLNRGKLGEALELHTKLRNDKSETDNMTDDFEEIRLMVTIDKEENRNIFSNNNAKPLILMVALKLLSVVSNNFVLYWIFIWNTFAIVGSRYILMGPAILSSFRLISSFFQTLFADSFARRFFLLTSCTLSGIAFLGLQIIVILKWNYKFEELNIYLILFLFSVVLQLFIGWGIDPLHHTLLSEVFATSKKNWSVVFVTTCENAAEIALIGLCFVDVETIKSIYFLFMFIPATYILVLAIILYYTLPETCGLSLSETKYLARNMTVTGWCFKKRW